MPVALPGAHVGSITIAERSLRGEISQGMCCLNSELGILDKAEQVHFFAVNVTNGTPLAEALNLTDAIITIDNKTLTHRPDLFCHIGFARELSALLRRPLHLKKLSTKATKVSKQLPYNVQLQTKLCRRYLGAAFDNITIAPSPDWLQQRLQAVGLRPINNVVDITNYVMLEYGQPLHAFDYAKLSGSKIKVRPAQAGERLQALDEKIYSLSPTQLVIADAAKPVAIAGIIGGAESAISPNTTSIALESANFDPVVVRLGAAALGVRTDASTRHEKNLPVIYPTYGFWRAAELLQKYAGARLASPIVDIGAAASKASVIKLNLSYVNNLTGVNFSVAAVQQTLKRLGCTVLSTTIKKNILQVKPPAYRGDLILPEDLIEEIARLFGYEKISPQPLTGQLEPQPQEMDWKIGGQLINLLVGAGASEVMGYSFYSEAMARSHNLPVADHLRLRNPMNPDQQLLRQTQQLGLLQFAKSNWQRGCRNFTLAEYGHVYLPTGEAKRVAFLTVGENAQEVVRTAKGLVGYLFKQAGIAVDLKTRGTTELIFEHQQTKLAQLQTYHDEKIQTAFVELYLSKLVNFWRETITVKALPQFPGIALDISMSLPDTVIWKDIENTIRRSGGGLITTIDVFDLYRGKDITAGHQVIGIRFWLQAPDRTLTMDEAEKIRHNVVHELTNKYQAKHRY